MLRSTVRGPRGRRRYSTSVQSRQLLMEPMERRLLFANFLVTSLSNSGPGTLRDAISSANDEINFPGPDTINFSVSGTISSSAEMAITSPITIAGPGASQLAISGGGAVRIFSTGGAPTGTAITFTGLTLRDGRTTTGAAVLVGDEAFTIRDSVVTGHVGTSTGGAVTVSAGSGTLTVDACTFSNNSSTAGGGVTCNSGTGMLITNSTFVGNVTTIGNTGGGIRFAGAVGPFGVTIRNCTISGNQSGFNGGGIGFGNNFVGTANIQNCTITNNTSVNTGGGGGVGINTSGSTGTVILESCIVSGNFATGTGTGPDLFGGANTPITANFCAIGTAAGAVNFVPNATTTALLGQNFNLAPLGSNGGPTQTHALQSPSPVIDTGSNPAGLAFDQRGAGFPRVLGGRADIGAYEAAAPTLPPTVSSSQFNFETGHSISIVFSHDVQASFTTADVQLLNLTTSTLIATGTMSLSYLGGTNPATITFPGQPDAQLPDGNYRLTLLASGITDFAGNFLDGDGNGTGGDNYSFLFFFLNGDANRDKRVNLDDFNILAANFGQSGRTFSQGNFNYDPAGTVNLNDFNILAASFGTVLAAPPASASLFGSSAIGELDRPDDSLSELLA